MFKSLKCFFHPIKKT